MVKKGKAVFSKGKEVGSSELLSLVEDQMEKYAFLRLGIRPSFGFFRPSVKFKGNILRPSAKFKGNIFKRLSKAHKQILKGQLT